MIRSAYFHKVQVISLIQRRRMSSASFKDVKSSPALARPSSSVVLISPLNEVLLLRRVKTASSFSEAFVFPGGNISTFQDGELPEAGNDPLRHADSAPYRLGALRECFEESGILLARDSRGQPLWRLPDSIRDEGRKMIHENQVKFVDWLSGLNGRPDTDGLIPFTRWITPSHLPRRYTTQMYLYFLPLAQESGTSTASITKHVEIPPPLSDGGIEHTTALFRSASRWLEDARAGLITLFPPQVYLLHHLSTFLSGSGARDKKAVLGNLKEQRDSLTSFIQAGDPPVSQMCICPKLLRQTIPDDGRMVLSLAKAGPEVEDSESHGDGERLVLFRSGLAEPREVEVVLRKDLISSTALPSRFKKSLL